MKEIKSVLEAVFAYLGALPVTEEQLLGASGVLILLLLLLGIRRRRKTRQAESPARLHGDLQEIRLLLDDRASKATTDITVIRKEIQELSVCLQGIEERLSLLELESPKKKTKLTKEAQKVVRPKALDEAPEPVPETVFSGGVHSGLKKTRSQFFNRLKSILQTGSDESSSQEIFRALEELLISSDLGVKTAQNLIDKLKSQIETGASMNEKTLQKILGKDIEQILFSKGASEILPEKVAGKPFVIAIVGVNGVGKTTTIGKLAKEFQGKGKKVILGACDTFRAAAVEQLQIWGNRLDVPVVSGAEGAKPSTVAYKAIHRGQEEGADVVLIDTAGRLHTRSNLMKELENVLGIISREQPDAPHETLLVLDASTGQNALQQAREFHGSCALSGIIVTKLDGTPKGGIVVAIKEELGIPIRYVGVGEGIEDLQPFSAKDFTEALLDSSDLETPSAEASLGERGRARRQRRRA